MKVGCVKVGVASTLVILIATTLVLGACGNSKDQDASSPSTSTAEASPQTVTTAVPGPPLGASLEGFNDLKVGACFDEVTDSAAEDRAVWLLDCAAPHTFESYWVTDYQGPAAGRGSTYPGIAAVQNFSEQACFEQFETFVGVRWTLSQLDIRTWWPTEESWSRADRKIICTVFSESGKRLAGSQQGSAE
jgi:hypothetical protein